MPARYLINLSIAALHEAFPLVCNVLFTKVLEAVLQHIAKDTSSFKLIPRGDIIHALEAENGLTELLLR